MPHVHITTRARDWLQRGDGAVTIRTSVRHGCCGGSAAVPVAEPGSPRHGADWQRVDVDGVAVWLAPGFEDTITLTVRLEGLWGLRRLFVDGADISRE